MMHTFPRRRRDWSRHAESRQPRSASAASADPPTAATRMPQQWLLFHSAVTFLLLTYIWRLQDIVPGLSALQLVSIVTVGAVALFLLQQQFQNLLHTSRYPPFRIASIILILMIGSIPAGIYMGNSLDYVLVDFSKTFLLMVLIAAGVRGTRNIERLLVINLIGATIYSAYAVSSGEVVDGRLSHLIYYDANDLGMLVVCTLPICVYFLRRGVPIFPKFIALTALPVLLLAFVRSGSRGAFLGILAIGAFMLFRFTAISRTARILTLSATVIAMPVIGGDQYLDLMKTLLAPTTDYNWVGNQDTGRMEVWKRGIGYMLHRPILGVGVNNFYVAEGTLSARGRQQQFGRGFKWSAAHNSFVQIGAELGVSGLLAFVALLYVSFKSTMRPLPRTGDSAVLTQQALGQTFAAALLGYIVTAFFLSQAYGAFLYSMIGLIIALDASRGTPALAPPPQYAPERPLGRGGLIANAASYSGFSACVCRSVSVCICGAAHRTTLTHSP